MLKERKHSEDAKIEKRDQISQSAEDEVNFVDKDIEKLFVWPHA